MTRSLRVLTVLLLTGGFVATSLAASPSPPPPAGATGATTAAATPPGTAPAAPTAVQLTADEVRHHLGHVIDWYHRLAGLGPNAALPDDVVTRERLHQLRLQEVRLAFVFGRAAAHLVAEEPAATTAETTDGSAPTGQDGVRYDRITSRMDERTAELKAQVAALDARIAKATAAERRVLTAQRAQLNAALALANEVQATAQQLQQFAQRSNSRASGETGLLADIADMERTVPEARLGGSAGLRADADGASAAARPAGAGTNQPPRDTGGLVTLASEWFDLQSSQRLHQHYIDATDELSTALDRLSSGLASEVRELLRVASTAATATDASQLAQQRSAIEAATARFRELSTLLIPLGEETITLDSTREVLEQRRGRLESRANAIARRLFVRAALLGAAIVAILGISTLWRRATFRYLHDPRRRRQFLALRRVTTTIALIIVVAIAFLSEVGSLATYIGFITAGLAVALQNVILAVVAYFFLIGRYGVRVGDRITMAGVTGRVAEIGLVRLYLTELAGPDLNPTGRMIVLSNAVVFQPQALFKQLPGVDFAWHSLSFTLAPSADPVLARERLQARANQVYETYRATIEQQVRAARHQVDFESINPAPEVSARFSSQGLDIAVRYPVPPDQAASIDQHMSRALREALDEEPRLALASAADASPAG